MHRPEEALDIQSELIFINGIVHLPQEWNFSTLTSFLHQLHHTQPSKLCQKDIDIHAYTTSHIQYTMCIECATTLQANNMREVKPCLAIHDW